MMYTAFTIFLSGTILLVDEICFKLCRVKRLHYQSYGETMTHNKDK
jgi:hypothetical protein